MAGSRSVQMLLFSVTLILSYFTFKIVHFCVWSEEVGDPSCNTAIVYSAEMIVITIGEINFLLLVLKGRIWWDERVRLQGGFRLFSVVLERITLPNDLPTLSSYSYL